MSHPLALSNRAASCLNLMLQSHIMNNVNFKIPEFKCMLLDSMSQRVVLSGRAGMLTKAYNTTMTSYTIHFTLSPS